MLEKITTILAYVKRIDGKLDAMGCNLNTSYSRTSVENNFLSLFPMKTVESLEEIESKLILDSVFEEKLIDCVTQIGGTNIHNFTKRVYSRLFTNQLATSYSWTGFRNNNQLQHLRITKIIKDVCMKNFKGTEVEFEANVKNWFKNGSQRQSREKQ
ncbi:uncharacterized protein LOC132933937 [Metopolophium dirhodum]|uniref:uncharacterized protein LOC132933594 n=1 Tax=Metopolophium dirhodum TaxID=44670 RepID=UPI0029901CE2|nr:uncharacterized protein LOC132933594 [Metopolophium dirhodum]XP_060855846.1 uncharacterized protein LOC132933598 [Metopolophium dirhodum]XP_060856200.1 uncharacterized protein LOC132933937 [Metopolophium dirhodum]